MHRKARISVVRETPKWEFGNMGTPYEAIMTAMTGDVAQRSNIEISPDKVIANVAKLHLDNHL